MHGPRRYAWGEYARATVRALITDTFGLRPAAKNLQDCEGDTADAAVFFPWAISGQVALAII